MIIYFIVIIILLLFSSNKRNHIYYSPTNIQNLGNLVSLPMHYRSIPILLLTAVIGLKEVSVGSDTISYYYRYENAMEMMTNESVQSEMGFNLMNLFFHDVIFFPWQLYLLFLSFVIIGGTSFFVNRFSDDVFFSFFIYLTIGCFTLDMSGIRQSLAISLCYVALTLLDYWDVFSPKKQLTVNFILQKMKIYIIPILLILLAASFHNSSIVFFVVFLMRHFRLSKKQLFVILLIAISAIFYKNLVTSLIPALEGTRYSTLDFDEEYAINPLVILVTITIPMAALYFIPTERDGKYPCIITLMFLFAALNIFFKILSMNQVLLGRMSDYFMNCYVILIPTLIYSLKRQNSIVIKSVISLLCIIMFYMGTKGGAYKIDHYLFFWQ